MNSYLNNYHERFFFFYGKTNDDFCLLPGGLLRLEEVLHSHLQDLKYRRILFYNGKQKLYFYDQESKNLCRPDIQNVSQKKEDSQPVKKKSKICAGPLGMRKIRQPEQNNHQSKEQSQTQENDDSLCYGQTNDLEVVGIIDHCMRDKEIKTALVFSDGLDFLLHTDHEAIRQMGANLTQWANESSFNENICVYILPDITVEDLKESLSRAPQWQFLKTKMFKQDALPGEQMIHIGYPQQDEVKNLVNYFRLAKKLNVNWLSFQDSVEEISREIATNDTQLKELCTRLIQSQDLDKLARQKDKSPALEKLESMRGLTSVAEKMEQFVLLQKEKITDKKTGQDRSDFCKRLLPKTKSDSGMNLHLILTGNPGTGKTTCAKIIGEIFRDAGLLESGHLVKASKQDLVAGYVGQTALQTAKKISQAMGGVLFVDEAYRFTEEGEHGFGKEAIETIMEAMSNHMGEFSVIAAGYPEKMNEFLDTNPGLKRRFGAQNVIHIPDYQPEDLRYIFELKAKEKKRTMDHELERLLPDFILNWHGARDPETFGNAGDVINLFEEMDSIRSVRVQKMKVEKEYVNTLTPDDIPERLKTHFRPSSPENPDDILLSLDDLIGLAQVKKMVKSVINQIKISQLREDGLKTAPGHYVFVGNPGTGKTTVARKMGEMLKSLGILKKGHLVEVGRSDLVAGYQGQTAIKTTEVLNESLDGVLFIDEAYQLVLDERDSFGKEALETLVAFMENHRDRLCIIAAGYPLPMEKFISQNPGLPSRFSCEIVFENYSPLEMLEIFKLMANERKMTLQPELDEPLIKLFEKMSKNAGEYFGNAREVRKIVDAMITNQANRLAESSDLNIKDKEALYRLEVQDIG